MTDSKLLSDDLLHEVEAAAREQNRQPAEVVAEAVERYLRLKRREKLYAYGEAQARKLGIRESDVPGLVKRVSRAEIEANDWSLTPGRYVGVAPEEVDEDFDFEAALRDIHIELKGLNEEAAVLAARIARNFEELGA